MLKNKTIKRSYDLISLRTRKKVEEGKKSGKSIVSRMSKGKKEKQGFLVL
jgi:hypothetical protein